MRIIIPTRNRPTSLGGVLRYYDTFYPDAQVILADGSDEAFKPLNAQLATDAKIEVDYRPFDSEVSLFDRLLAVLNSETDAYFIMAADDDYPIMETMAKAQARLEADTDAVCAGGYLIHIDVHDENSANARLDPARHIMAPNAAQRMRTFGQLPFTTTYAVARRERLIARYEFLKGWNMPGFFDLGVGLMDMADGKFIAIADLGFICTRNKVHSYYRSTDHLVYLRKADEVLRLFDITTKRLQEVDGLDEEEARTVLSRVINNRVAALAGAPPFRITGFTDRAPYKTDMVTRTRAAFTEMFSEGTEQREKYGARLAFIADNLQNTLQSQDNAGEDGKYESL